jgi:hypothetical protein
VRSAVALGLSLTAGAALAAPVTWTVPATTLPDGHVVSGTFVYDTDTSAISNVNITQTVVRPGVYSYAANLSYPYGGAQRTATVAVGDEIWWADMTGAPGAGGSFSTRIGTGSCSMAGICTIVFAANIVNGVTLTGVPVAAAVPTMSEWAMILFGTVLAGGAALVIHRKRLA